MGIVLGGGMSVGQHAAIAHTSAMILDGALVDADINAAAAIAWPKVSKVGAALADLPTRLHGSLDGVTPDQHHTQDHHLRHEWGGGDEVQFLIPIGAIIMWHGTLANIPSGWALCDGADGRPDLRGRFVRGAPAATDPGATGGVDNQTTSVHGGHTHTIPHVDTMAGGINTTAVGSPSGSGGNHSHTLDNRPAYYEIAYIIKTA